MNQTKARGSLLSKEGASDVMASRVHHVTISISCMWTEYMDTLHWQMPLISQM